jgi:hypothetical protein
MTEQLGKLIAEIRALPLEDRQSVLAALADCSAAVDERSPLDEQAADEAYQRLLLAAGLITEIRPLRRDQTAFDRYTPVSISGEPLSQTIIQERR